MTANFLFEKLVSVHRALKELQNDAMFVSKLLSAGAVVSKIYLAISWSAGSLTSCLLLQEYNEQPDEMVSFCSSFSGLFAVRSYHL